jgi:prevent-host-death family protein
MYTFGMELSLSEARARLPELLDRVAAGETVTITRHGKPAAALVDHDRWMKTRTHDVLVRAAQLRHDLDAARGTPWPEKFTPSSEWDSDAQLAELRTERDADVWDRVERGE